MQAKPDRVSVVLDEGDVRSWHKKCFQEFVDQRGKPLGQLLVKPSPGDDSWAVRFSNELFYHLVASNSPFHKIPQEDVESFFESVERWTPGTCPEGNDSGTLWLDFTEDAPHRELLAGERTLLWWLPAVSSPYPPGVRELLAGLDGLPLTLREESSDDEDSLLRKARLRNIRYSYRKQNSNLLEHASKWPAETYEHYPLYEQASQSPEVSSPASPPVENPLLHLARLGLTLLREKIRRGTRKFLKRDTWNIGLVDHELETVVEDELEVERVQWAQSDRGDVYRADPCGAQCNSGRGIFFERYRQNENQGDICYSENLFDDEGLEEIQILPGDLHQSYPCVFEHDGTYYMVLEEAESMDLNLYEADPFPGSWIQQRTLVEDFPALDPTIFRHHQTWWLTASSREDSGNYALYVWYSDQLEGPWIPHNLRPVKRDVRNSRPAGTPFRVDNKLYRPSQNCSKRYGREIVLNRVDEISPSTYRETPVRTLSPDPDGLYPDGIHTLSSLGNQILLDGKREEITLKPLLSHLKSIFSG